MRLIGVGRALVQVDFLEVFGIDIFLREDGIVAAVIDRDAGDGEADFVAVEAADRQLAAEQAGRVGRLRIDAGQAAQDLEDVRGRRLLGDGRVGHV